MTGFFARKIMNARPLLHIIDQISYWSGKAFAWLIVG